MKKMISFLVICLAGILLVTAGFAETAAPKLILSETEVRVAVGKNIQLKAAAENPASGKQGKAAWESSDPEVCTVTASGAVKAVSEGTAVIICTMTFPEGETLSAECRVTTFVAAKQVKAATNNLRLNVGETITAEYTILPENVTEKSLSWSSADEAVAAVDAEGRITGISPGTTRVTAQTKDGSNLKAVFTVYVPTLAAAETDYTISNLTGLTIPVSYYGSDFEKSISVRATGKPVAYTTRYEENRIELHLDAREAGDSRIEITDKKDGKAKLTLTVHTEEKAIPNNVLLEITSIKFRKNNNGLTLNLDAQNHSSRKIVKVYYAMDFRTKSGDQIFFPQATDGTGVPIVNPYRESSWAIKPGAKGNDTFSPEISRDQIKESDIDEVRCALVWIQFEDGSYTDIPDEQKYWFSSKSGYIEKPDLTANYTGPSHETWEKAYSVRPGFDQVQVSDFLRPWYGTPAAGIYVTRVEPDSIADLCGLHPKDLITEVDGIRWSDDIFTLIRGQAKMADGETVTVKVLRNNEPMELMMAAGNAGTEPEAVFLAGVLAAVADPEYEQLLSALQSGEIITPDTSGAGMDVLRRMLAAFGYEADSRTGAEVFEALNRIQRAFGITASEQVDAEAFSRLLPLLLLTKDTDGTYADLLRDHYEAGEHAEGRYRYLQGCAYYAVGCYYRAKEAFEASAYGDYEERAAACTQEWPENGELWHNSSLTGKRMILKFSVNARDESEGNYFEVLTEDGSRASVMFQKGSGSVSASLPGGLYKIRDASGTVWYGMKDLFGREGHYEYMRFDEFAGDEYLTELTGGYQWTITINVTDVTGTGIGSVDTDWDSWNAE